MGTAGSHDALPLRIGRLSRFKSDWLSRSSNLRFLQIASFVQISIIKSTRSYDTFPFAANAVCVAPGGVCISHRKPIAIQPGGGYSPHRAYGV